MRALALARRDGAPAYASVTVVSTPVMTRRLGARCACRARALLLPRAAGAGGQALCGLGEAAPWSPRGAGRFGEAHWPAGIVAARTLADGAEADPASPPGAGPVFMGGFAFAPDGGVAPEWAAFAPALLVLPELSMARHGGEARLTADGGGAARRRARRGCSRAWRTAVGGSPAIDALLDPDPVTRARWPAPRPRPTYEEAVRRAVERIRSGPEMQGRARARGTGPCAVADRPGAGVRRPARGVSRLLLLLRGRLGGTFVGASPELLVRRDGARAQTVALAGTTRRSADPAVDTHLGEQLLQSAKNRARAGDRGRADRAHAGPGERVGGGGRASRCW